MQMAIDSWLLEQHRAGLQPPILRFYTWSPPAISLGFHQRHYPEFWQHLTWQGTPVDLVRRPSGGRAVLHQGDLTYAVIASGLPGSRRESYQFICEFLIQGWRTLGVELHYGSAGRGYIHNPNCFGTSTGADLVTPEGAKLIGSAQLRRELSLLQHGSMRLATDPELFQQIFGIPLEPLSLPQGIATETRKATIVEALVAAAGRWFGVEFDEQPLTLAEWQAITAQAKQLNQELRPSQSLDRG